MGVGGKPLCCFHGSDGVNTTSWGASVLRDPADGIFYMWVAQMTNGCDLSSWQTNSEIVLAKSLDPLGPFEPISVVLPPWGHNPQAIRAPDDEHGHVYALYALGDGVLYNGPPRDCRGSLNGSSLRSQRQRGAVAVRGEAGEAGEAGKAGEAGETITANFTISFAQHPRGPYAKHVASILEWPATWDYGEHGNWNPSPLVHPNGTIFLMAHTSSKGFMNGEAIIAANSWRGPYRVVASNTYDSWGGHVWRAEDPFMWIDKRGAWHVLYNWGGGGGPGGPGGHAFSSNGIHWSPIAAAFNSTRPVMAGPPGSKLWTVNYWSERPKLLFAEDGTTPTHLYAGSSKATGYTIVSPLPVMSSYT